MVAIALLAVAAVMAVAGAFIRWGFSGALLVGAVALALVGIDLARGDG